MTVNGQDLVVLISTLSIAFNVMMVILQSKIKAEIAELRTHMYERFTTKDDVHYMLRRAQEDRPVHKI